MKVVSKHKFKMNRFLIIFHLQFQIPQKLKVDIQILFIFIQIELNIGQLWSSMSNSACILSQEKLVEPDQDTILADIIGRY